MNETEINLEKLSALERELDNYKQAMDDAANAIESTEREIIDVIESLTTDSVNNTDN